MQQRYCVLEIENFLIRRARVISMTPLTRIVSQIRNFPRANLHGITRKVLIRFNKPRLFVAKLDFRSKELNGKRTLFFQYSSARSQKIREINYFSPVILLSLFYFPQMSKMPDIKQACTWKMKKVNYSSLIIRSILFIL